MKLRRAIVPVLAIVCMSFGFFLAYQVFDHFRSNIISQHEEKLSDIVNSIDRSAQGYFHIYYDSLDYITGRRGFVEAETKWEQTGDTEDLQFRMEENLLNRDMQVKTILAIDNGKVLLSADGNTGYQLPEQLEDTLFICQDNDGASYLAILHQGQVLSYAALIDMNTLCDYLAGSSAVNETDHMLLVDRDGKLLICHHQAVTTVQSVNDETLALSPARMIAWQAVGTDIRQVSLFETQTDEAVSTVGYALIGNNASENSFFTICVMDTYDAYLDALSKDTIWFIISCSITLSGILLLLYCVSSLSRKNRKAAKDLEQMKQRQAALEKINEQTQKLAHHQRLETIGTLTSSISHEFNNLLTPIMSYSLLTLEKLPAEEDELYDNVLEIYNASQKAKVIISRLSDISRKNSPKTFREVSVDDLVKKALDIAMPAKPEHVEVRLNLNCWDLRIRANEIQVCQMLLNLILNAFQAMDGRGTLQIHTTFHDDSVQICVSDNGCGIPDEIQEKIFDPFFTTKESGKGTGLGLAIVAQVVEDHLGTIEVSSKTGQGTQFKVSLPRHPETE